MKLIIALVVAVVLFLAVNWLLDGMALTVLRDAFRLAFR